MKQSIAKMNWKMILTLIMFNLVTVVLMAQENSGSSGSSQSSGSSSTTSTTKSVSLTQSENWYASPWVWVIGAAVFILLLVALLGGNRKSTSASDRVTVTKTVERDTDV